MNTFMTKHRVVMSISKVTRRFPKDTIPFDTRSTEADDVAESDLTVDKQFFMSRFDWEEMGKPETITITVEPGDKLNEGSDS